MDAIKTVSPMSPEPYAPESAYAPAAEHPKCLPGQPIAEICGISTGHASNRIDAQPNTARGFWYVFAGAEYRMIAGGAA